MRELNGTKVGNMSKSIWMVPFAIDYMEDLKVGEEVEDAKKGLDVFISEEI